MASSDRKAAHTVPAPGNGVAARRSLGLKIVWTRGWVLLVSSWYGAGRWGDKQSTHNDRRLLYVASLRRRWRRRWRARCQLDRNRKRAAGGIFLFTHASYD